MDTSDISDVGIQSDGATYAYATNTGETRVVEISGDIMVESRPSDSDEISGKGRTKCRPQATNAWGPFAYLCRYQL
jgi:hypothetical protein